METCRLCEEKPIWNQKRQLCSTCYGRERKKGFPNKGVPEQVTSGHLFESEFEFIKNYFKGNGEWYHAPARFNLGMAAYTPDFYDCSRNVFIEVVSSRQAYHQNKGRYELFAIRFPQISLEIRKTDGSLLDTDADVLDWNGTKQNTDRESR